MAKLPFAGKKVLITGATAGIGAATADAFAAAGADVIALGRRKERLEELASQWADEHAAHITPVHLDITDREAVLAMAQRKPAVFDVDILVNNAGLARGTDPMPEAEYDDWKEMVDTNVLGLLSMTRTVIPALTKRQGHVVNVGSVAGRWTYPGGGVYCATKFAVRALSEGLRLDLQGTGVRVTNIEPGLVETEFSQVRFDGDTERAAKVYEGYTPLEPGDIADSIVWCCTRPAHVNIQEMVVFPTHQPGVGYLDKQ